MDKKIKDKLFKAFIWLFAALYTLVAGISFWHCIEFCMVGNPLILSVMMSFAFEVGLALTLFAILVNDTAKNNVVSWILMSLLTCVQVMGNIFSVEKYMEITNNGFYVYIQNGFLHWFTEDMAEKEVMSIIAIILGALLPFVALLMTSMVATNWKEHVAEMKALEEEEKKRAETELPPPPPIDYAPPMLDEREEEMRDFDNFINNLVKEENEQTQTEETELSKNENDEEKEFKGIETKKIDVPAVGDAEKLLEAKKERDTQQILDIKPEITVADGSLLSDQEHEEIERNTVQPNIQKNRPVINFFNPM